jgi:hypothetical protein
MHSSRAGGAEGLDLCCPGHAFCGAAQEFGKDRTK